MYFCLLLLCPILVTASNILTIKSPIQINNRNTQQFQMTRMKGDINSDTFTQFKHLTALVIEWCAIHDMDPEAFKTTPLIILDIHNNIEFPSISASTFEHLQDLKVFRFNFNPYTDIEEGAFSNLKKLEVLSISHQSLENLTKSFFEGLENLGEFALTHNEIKYIEKNAFEHMKNLTAVYLGYNFLKTIEPGTFRQHPKLENLQLQSNELGNEDNSYTINWAKFDRIISLRYLNIGENNLNFIDVQRLVTAFPMLESANFMPNNFTCPNELYITRMFRHYRIQIEYYGNTRSSCTELDYQRLGNRVFPEF